MSVNLVVSEQIAEQIEHLSWGEAQTVDDKLSWLLAAELRRRLAGYRLTDPSTQAEVRPRFRGV